ncbi:MAG: SEL1-like repeat protein [Prevotella sp.]|nr:SEL1-like repeat protein [Prevotella sp.]
MRKILYLILFFLSCSLTYSQKPDKSKKIYDEGIEYLEKGDTVKAIKYIQKAARANNYVAQRLMVYSYLSGLGVPQDIKKAEYWAKKYVEGTLLDYRTFIGYLYFKYDLHNSHEIDYLEAAYWLKEPAEQGDTLAQRMLSKCYNNGGDYKRAETLIYSFAERGDVYAQYDLGMILENMYETDTKGLVNIKNKEQAVYWYKKAAEQGYVMAQSHLGFMYQDGKGVAKDDKLAIYWFEKAAEQGHYGIQLHLGDLYYRENEMQDYAKAAYWLEKAAKQGSAYASDKLCLMYVLGRGVPKDFEKAKFWKSQADSLISTGDSFYKRNKTVFKQPEMKYFLSGATQNYKMEKRIALVIANSDYEQPVPSAEKDAKALIKTLSGLNFNVVPCINKEKIGMEETIASFCEKAKGYDVALIYYAGHAVQEKGVNYLIPARPEKILNSADMNRKYTELSWVINSLDSSAKKKIVIIDACHARPRYVSLIQKGKDGLAPMREQKDFVLAFPARFGKTVQDRNAEGRSHYMSALLEELNKPYQDIDEIFRNVRDSVIKYTNGEQVPYYMNALKEGRGNKFYFNIKK